MNFLTALIHGFLCKGAPPALVNRGYSKDYPDEWQLRLHACQELVRVKVIKLKTTSSLEDTQILVQTADVYTQNVIT